MAEENKRRSGFTTLEYAAVLPVLLAFIFGAIDVTNYFRAYTAVQEAVNSGLRCLYPTDAECLKVSAPQTVPLNELYIPPFKASQHNYDGMEKHLILPNYSFGSIQAKTLKQVHFTQPGSIYGTARERREGNGEVKYIISRNPGADGDYQHATLSGGISLASRGSVNGRIACKQAHAINIGEITFTVPSHPLRNDPDFDRVNDCIEQNVDGSLDYPRNGDIKEARCDAGSVHDKTRIFFNIKGDGYTIRNGVTRGNSNVSGHLNMRLEYRDGSGAWINSEIAMSEVAQSPHGYWNLGGQQFSGASDQNFIPRGFNYEEFQVGGGTGSSSTDIHFQKYAYIKIPFGKQARITFSLNGLNGSECDDITDVGWVLRDAQIAIPQYSLPAESMKCAQTYYNSQCPPQSSNCTINPGESMYYNVLENRVGPVLSAVCGNVVSQDDAKLDNVCSLTPPGKETLLNKRQPLAGPPGDYGLYTGSACEVADRRDCESNFGVSTLSQFNAHGDSFVTDSDEAQSACAAPADSFPASRRWDEGTDTVYTAPITLEGADCSVGSGSLLPASLIPSAAAAYKKLILPPATYTDSAPSYKYPGNPDELRQTPQFSCAAVSTGEIFYDEAHEDSFHGEEKERMLRSLFVGSHNQLGCQRDEILREEAVSIGMNPAAYFKVNGDAPTSGSYFLESTSVDACMTVVADGSLANSNLRKKVPGGPFDEGIVPVSCIVQGANACISIPAGVREIEGSDSTGINADLARQRAVEALNAFMPGAHGDIELNNYSDQKEFDPTRDPFSLKAKIEVPMLLLANKPIPVIYEAQRSWEANYLR